MPQMIVDSLFVLATLTFGWGLSLATYRMFAQYYGWPMGTLQADVPVIPVLIGLACLTLGFLFAAARGAEQGGWVIVVVGLLVAIFWTGFMRVASQTSLFLAPIAALLLVLNWLGYQERLVEKYRELRYRQPSSYEMIDPKVWSPDKRAAAVWSSRA